VIQFRPVLFVVGLLLTTLGSAMMLPGILDLTLGHDDWLAFAAASAVTLFVGVTLVMSTRGGESRLTIRSAFVLTTASWLSLVAFAALPLFWSTLNMSYTDAFFESMSGLTTTGATVIVGLDFSPPGVLLWRGMLHWLGGVGIIVMAIAVLPMLQIGGMQLFRMESSDTSEKILPRATQIAGSISLLYLGLTVVCALAYYMAGMRLFDAVTHAMATIATGGFSTHDASIGYFDSTAIDLVVTLFMIVGALPFSLYLLAIRNKGGPLVTDSQVRWFFGMLIIFLAVVSLAAMGNPAVDEERGWRQVLFHVVSIMTGTGFATTDYGLWGGHAVAVFFFIAFVGGCTGSATGGIKIFRFQVLFAALRQHVNRIIYPNGVFVPLYNGRALPDHVSASVLGFLFLFVLTFAALTMGLSFTGLDPLTAFSSAASAIANVGPGLGEIVGPAGNFKSLPDSAKWIMSAGMLLGRLELLTILVMFSPSFWRG